MENIDVRSCFSVRNVFVQVTFTLTMKDIYTFPVLSSTALKSIS